MSIQGPLLDCQGPIETERGHKFSEPSKLVHDLGKAN